MRKYDTVVFLASHIFDMIPFLCHQGDFIFYSILVAKAAQYSFATFAACMLVILAGLGGIGGNISVVIRLSTCLAGLANLHLYGYNRLHHDETRH